MKNNEVTEETLVEEVVLEKKSKSKKSEITHKVDDFDWSTVSDLNSSKELNKDEESMYFSTILLLKKSKCLTEKL